MSYKKIDGMLSEKEILRQNFKKNNILGMVEEKI